MVIVLFFLLFLIRNICCDPRKSSLVRSASFDSISKFLTHCTLVDSSTVMLDKSVIVRVSDLLCHFYSIFDGKYC